MLEENKRDIEKAAKGAGISLIGSVTGRGTWFLCQVIIARLYGAEIFGMYILGLTVLKISEIFARFGLHTGAMRFVSIYRNDSPEKVKGILISSFSWSFITGILFGGLLYLLSGFISNYLFHKPELIGVVRKFAVGVPFMAAMMVVATASRGFHTTKYSVYIKNIVQPSTNLALISLFSLFDFGIEAIVNAFVISYVIALFVGFFFIVRQFREIKEKPVKPVFENKKLLTYSLPLMFSGFLLFLISWTDTIMLGILSTSENVGIYRAASQTPRFLLLALMASNSIYAPIIAEMFHHKQKERLEKIFKVTTRWVFYLTLPVALILIFSSKEVMSIFGYDFIEIGAPVLVVLTIAQFINCLTGGVGPTLIMTGKQNIELINTIVMVIINIFLNYLLIPLYGSFGAAVATGISIASINLLRLSEVYYFYKIHPYNKGYQQGIVSGTISVIALLVIGNFFNIDLYLEFIIKCFIVGAIFISFLFVMGIQQEDRYIFDTLVKKLYRRA